MPDDRETLPGEETTMQAMLLCATCGLPVACDLEDLDSCPECGVAEYIMADDATRFLSCKPV